jgi:PAS domain S-box-containing protein
MVSASHSVRQESRDPAQRLMDTLESITDAFLTLDRAGCFTYVNSRAEKLLQRQRAELLGVNVWEVFPELAGSTFQFECQRAIAEGVSVNFESFMTPWGVWLDVTAFPSVQGLAVHCRDVSEKHQARQRLLEEQDTLSAVIQSTSNAVISIDEAGRINIFNPAAERIFRRSRESMQGQSLELLLPGRFRAAHQTHRQHFLDSKEPSRMMGMGLVKGLRSDGVELDLEVTISQVTVQQQQVLIAILKDVSARVRADANMALSRAQLSSLTQRLMTQEKVLVKRLAQTLHDQLGQTMAAIRMAHETIITLQKGQAAADVGSLQGQLGKLISQAIRQVRQVLVDLRPPLLDEQGLVAALDNELRNRSLTQPLVDISISVPPEIALLRWSGELEYAAFMVAREAVENSLRHARASSVAVRLSGTAATLQLEVVDNGVGIKEGATKRTGHLGILGMQERAHAVGASVVLDAAEPKGARVRFNWQAGV